MVAAPSATTGSSPPIQRKPGFGSIQPMPNAQKTAQIGNT